MFNKTYIDKEDIIKGLMDKNPNASVFEILDLLKTKSDDNKKKFGEDKRAGKTKPKIKNADHDRHKDFKTSREQNYYNAWQRYESNKIGE